MNKSGLGWEIWTAWKNVLTEIIALLFVACVFMGLYNGELEKSLIFGLLLIALQIEKVADALSVK